MFAIFIARDYSLFFPSFFLIYDSLGIWGLELGLWGLEFSVVWVWGILVFLGFGWTLYMNKGISLGKTVCDVFLVFGL